MKNLSQQDQDDQADYDEAIAHELTPKEIGALEAAERMAGRPATPADIARLEEHKRLQRARDVAL